MEVRHSFKELLKTFTTKRMMVIFFMGFSSGLPLMLVGAFLKLWLRRSGVDISTIGMMTWVMVPYSFNFLVGPLLDRYIPFSMGRRRSWLLITQIGLILGLMAIGFFDPGTSVVALVITAFLISCFSAMQDVAVDAYRRERLPEDELGIGSTYAVFGYRLAMLAAWGWGPLIVGMDLGIGFAQWYQLMALAMLVGLVTTLVCLEPPMEGNHNKNLLENTLNSFREFFHRENAIYILAFILLYKLGDSFAGSLLPAYYVDIGFSDEQVGTIAGMFGLASSITALAVGGSIVYFFGLYRALWICGICQALSTGVFALLKITGPNSLALAGVILFEDFSSGMGTAALIAFMATMANKQYTATQYALFSSLASSGRTIISGFAGFVQKYLGWFEFYIFGSILAIPGLFLLYKMIQIQKKQAAASQIETPTD